MKLSKIHIPFDDCIADGALYQKIRVPKDFKFKKSIFKTDGLWVYYTSNLLGFKDVELCAIKDDSDLDLELELEFLDVFMISSGSLFILYKILR